MAASDNREKGVKKRLRLGRESCNSEDSQDEWIDYSPTVFLRCHSKNNDPTDKRTSVWQSAFEPAHRNSDNPKHSTMFATCGGQSVCVIDAESQSVITKHYSKDCDEDFTAMAWTSLLTVDGPMNILGVAGRKAVLHLLHPDNAVCFAEHLLMKKKDKRQNIESIMFHPNQRSILFGALKLRDSGEIYIWDIGTPYPPEYDTTLVLIQILQIQSPVCALTFSKQCNMLLSASEKGAVGWLLPPTALKKTTKFKQQIFEFPSSSENLPPEDKNFVDSIEAIGDGKMIATKCALHGYIYIWDLENTLKSCGQVVKPLHTLKWSNTDNYYMNMGINARSTMLACGDDMGNLWVYNLEEILASDTQQHDCKTVIPSPDVQTEYLVKHKKLRFDNIDIVVNKVAFNEDASYLVAVTSTNTVCIWRRSDKTLVYT